MSCPMCGKPQKSKICQGCSKPLLVCSDCTRFCPICGTKIPPDPEPEPMIKGASTGDFVITGQGKVDQSVHHVQQQFYGVPTQSMLNKCPECGRRNSPEQTFECRVCHRDHLCLDHFIKASKCCEMCAPAISSAVQVLKPFEENGSQGKEEIRKCPECGRRIKVDNTFDCNRCGREYLCQDHFDKIRKCCETCASSIQRELEEQKKREIEEQKRNDERQLKKRGFLKIPEGTFQMGSPESENGRSSDETLHTVRISRSFYMLSTPVTQALWNEIMDDNPSDFEGDDRPVEQVTWFDAIVFCNRLSECDGKRPCYYDDADFEEMFDGECPIEEGDLDVFWDDDADGYRLPTEAEWEYACRAGTKTAFNSGSCTQPGGTNPALDRAGWYCENSDNETHHVKQKARNRWGLYDMHGNVYEWCWDWYDDYPSKSMTDPTGPSFGSGRVLRGGSWYNLAQSCRSAARNAYAPGYRYGDRSFRPVMSGD